MDHVTLLLNRLDEIAASLAASGHGLALMALGSAGAARERLDAYSDIDFFAIVAAGHKAAYLADLRWLTDIAPVAYHFRNTRDGYKLLYADGVFCECAVFEPAELSGIGAAASRVVWQAPGFDLSPYQRPDAAPPAPEPVEFLLGEALSNLYVGLGRYRRGEKLTAMRFVQEYAVNSLIALVEQLDQAPAAGRDPFNPSRRLEQRHPALAAALPAMLPGYAHTPAAARAILSYLEARLPVNAAMRDAILALAEE